MSLRNAMLVSALALGLAHAGAAQAPEFSTTTPHAPPRGNSKSGAARAKRDAKKRRNTKKRQRGFADPMWLLGMLAVLAIVVIASAAVSASKRERAKWDRLKAEQKCVIVARQSSSLMTTTGFDAKGNVVFGTTVNPAKTAWKCNDGVTYWK